MFERATREWRMSPTMATFRPSMRPLYSRIVKASSKACVGCSCEPSPAFTIGALHMRARCCGAPAIEWRMTMQSGAIASRLRAVSSNVSPLVTLDVETLTFTASADSRFAAISNDVRVRVEDSKKRLMTVRPRSAGTFLISRLETSRKVSAVSSRCVISPGSRSLIPNRCRRLKVVCTVAIKKAANGRFRSSRFGRPFHDYHTFFLVKLLEHDLDDLALLRRHELADVISL